MKGENSVKIGIKEINEKEYDEDLELNIIEKLKKAEEQIKNGEVIDADIVFKEMRKKYGY